MFENCESWECGAMLVVICNGPTIDWLCFFNQNGAVEQKHNDVYVYSQDILCG